MKLKIKTLEQAIESKKELKTIAPDKDEIIRFKKELKTLVGKLYDIDNRKDDETEEHLKTDLRDFLIHSVYSRDEYAINTKGKIDLAIYLGNTTNEKVGVIIEAKRPKNKGEMISFEDLNKKAFHELVLYYFDERIKHNNSNLKYLIITNVLDWYLIDVNNFENKIFNKKLKDEYENCKNDEKKNPYFYKEAKKIISSIDYELPCIHFNIKEYEEFSKKDTPANRKKIINLYKVLSPNFLLKKQLANDSNKLNTNFYKELLHIIGVEEVPKGGKNIITRKEIRDNGSFIENTINILETEDSLRNFLHLYPECKTKEDKIYTIALELVLTWVNRILFLKLLEGQLLSYHKENQNDYKFLNPKKINDFDEMYKLFHQVLARNYNERPDQIKEKYKFVPYLNSSLFEISEIEDLGIKINSLDDNLTIPVFNKTKTAYKGHQLNPLKYLLEFLKAYTFGGNQKDDYQSDELINASVLGNIFEKINGYKDGSFYTPGFITQYMCKETIERAVIQKFNEVKGWKCEDFIDLHNKEVGNDLIESNRIIDSVKICDPAVGSGHFLVSALNQMIAIKYELNVLVEDRNSPRYKKLLDVHIKIINDELVILNKDNSNFKYDPSYPNSHKIQKAIFEEKQNIIENCLFGVDINSNSVKICRLRLWIELLKNAYYIKSTDPDIPDYLETLPNIDINIKCGNSLISRFELEADLKEALKKTKLKIDDYKHAVNQYRNAENKEQKREMETIIADIKSSFQANIDNPFRNKIKNARWDVNKFETEINTKKQWGEKIEKSLIKDYEKAKSYFQVLEKEQQEIKSNKIYDNAFEWRFEFPEVLNDDGDFVGFDVIIGNPPYGVNINRKINPEYSNFYNEIILGELETYIVFYYRGLKLLKSKYFLSYITPDSWLTNNSAKLFRQWLCEKDLIDVFDYYKPFADAKDTRCHSVLIKNSVVKDSSIRIKQVLPSNPNEIYRNYLVLNSSLKDFKENEWRLYLTPELRSLFKQIDNNSITLDEVYNIKYGLRTGDNNKYISSEKTNYPIIAGADISSLYGIKWKEKYLQTIDSLPNSYFGESFTDKKIIVQYVRTNSLDLKARWIEAAYVEGNYIPLNSLSFIYNKNNDFALKYLIALLNSFLINSYYRSYYTDVNVKPAYISKIPLPSNSIEKQKPFIEKVDQILALKEYNPDADTSALEREIDLMVYKLYGLTYEEVMVIDAEFIMTKNDYENK